MLKGKLWKMHLVYRKVEPRDRRAKPVWLLIDGGLDGGEVYADKHDAVQCARRDARKLGWACAAGKWPGRRGVSLVIHAKDGRILEERTYPRGADPRRSKG